MTKQEKIKEVYGEFYDKLKNEISENGYVFQGHLLSLGSDTYEFISKKLDLVRNVTSLMPKSLVGIHDNNGWIKIDSENDLPKENTNCHILYTDGSYSTDLFLTTTNQFRSNSWKYITHYQPIVKPEPPIY